LGLSCCGRARKSATQLSFGVRQTTMTTEIDHANLLKRLNYQSTWSLALLTMVTFGAYPAHYIYRQTSIINQYIDSEEQCPKGCEYVIFVFFYLNALCGIASLAVVEGHPVQRISDIFGLAWGLLALFWSLWARGRMNKLLYGKYGQPYSYSISWSIIFFFCYFNYRSNKIYEMLSNKSL
jgi:hypothetical protein